MTEKLDKKKKKEEKKLEKKKIRLLRRKELKSQPKQIVKKYVSAKELLQLSFTLAKKVYESNFMPTWIIALWRGGSFVGCAVQEYMEWKGVKTDHIAVRTSHYSGIDSKFKGIRIHGLHYVIENAEAKDKVLIVDDVFDTGKSIEKLFKVMKKKMRKNLPLDIRVAVVYFKPKRNQTSYSPEFYVEKSEDWIVFPHELDGLTNKEIEAKGDGVGNIVLDKKKEDKK